MSRTENHSGPTPYRAGRQASTIMSRRTEAEGGPTRPVAKRCVLRCVGEGALPLGVVERHHGGVAGPAQVRVGPRSNSCRTDRSAGLPSPPAPSVGRTKAPSNWGFQAAREKPRGWGTVPAVIVDQKTCSGWLTSNDGEMAPDAEVADHQLFAAAGIEVEQARSARSRAVSATPRGLAIGRSPHQCCQHRRSPAAGSGAAYCVDLPCAQCRWHRLRASTGTASSASAPSPGGIVEMTKCRHRAPCRADRRTLQRSSSRRGR